MEKKTYSISMRLRRTTVEYAFVSVPLEGDLWEPHPDESGKLRINTQKVAEIAKLMGAEDGVLWARESDALIELHPWQIPPPRG
jgi:hypothetical protein